MTDNATETLEAGRELDALVAEKVIGAGFVKKTVGDGPWAKEILMLTDAGCKCHRCQKTGNTEMVHGPMMHGMAYPEVRPYSTDIASAWDVVDEVWGLTGKWILVSPFGARFCAYHKTGCGDADFGDFCEYGTTAPHAICLAALKAVEHE